MMRIGIDVGGTFTDLVLLDEPTGATTYHKLPSTPHEPHLAPLQGIAELLRRANARPQEVTLVGLGTTVATNALLERKGSRTGLLTTDGFRDVLEIGRQKRPMVFDPFTPKPVPLIPRELRTGVRERVAFDGTVLTPLVEDDVIAAVEALRGAGVTSVAICFLHAYANPEHERRAAAIVAELWPQVNLVTSAALVPEVREYERLSTTVVNAYLAESMRDYLAKFAAAVRDLGIEVEPFVLGSSGGVLRAHTAARRPVDTLFSGPSGGVSGAGFVAMTAGVRDAINLDMGGTSTEVCLVRDGVAELTHERVVEGLPLKTTSVAVHTIGAGGSSIAWIDAGGLLHVGPQSAGADPGPACYGRGGELPTVTDANVVLGRLNPEYLLGGALRIDKARAAAALERFIGKPKGLAVHEAAAAVLAVSNNAIAQAIRVVSTQRGLDPADYTLIAYGGAGPLHAGSVALELGITDVLVPDGPGLLCALGVLTKDVEMDLSASRLIRDSAPEFEATVRGAFAALSARAHEELGAGGPAGGQVTLRYSADARYAGQNFELPITVDLGDRRLVRQIREAFHRVHAATYGYADETREVEVVTFRARAIVSSRARPAAAPALPEATGRTRPLAKNWREVYFEELGGFVHCGVYDRTALCAGHRIAGPAIVEQMDTTTIVPPGLTAGVDAQRNLRLSASRSLERAA